MSLGIYSPPEEGLPTPDELVATAKALGWRIVPREDGTPKLRGPASAASNRLAKAIAALLKREPYRSLVPAEAAKVWDATPTTAGADTRPVVHQPTDQPRPESLPEPPAGPRVDHDRDSIREFRLANTPRIYSLTVAELPWGYPYGATEWRWAGEIAWRPLVWGPAIPGLWAPPGRAEEAPTPEPDFFGLPAQEIAQ